MPLSHCHPPTRNPSEGPGRRGSPDAAPKSIRDAEPQSLAASPRGQWRAVIAHPRLHPGRLLYLLTSLEPRAPRQVIQNPATLRLTDSCKSGPAQTSKAQSPPLVRLVNDERPRPSYRFSLHRSLRQRSPFPIHVGRLATRLTSKKFVLLLPPACCSLVPNLGRLTAPLQ